MNHVNRIAKKETIICAHRGGGGDAAETWEHWPEGFAGAGCQEKLNPEQQKNRRNAWENQLTTFKDSNTPVWELDIWLNKDNVPVVNHDGNLSRTHGCDKFIAECSTGELAELEPPVATLAQILDVAEAKKRIPKIFIELKAGTPTKGYSYYGEEEHLAKKYEHIATPKDKQLAQIVAGIVKERVNSGIWKKEKLPLIGFIHDQLEAANEKNVVRGYNFSRESFGYTEEEMNADGEALGLKELSKMLDIVKETRAVSINPDYRFVSSDFVEKAHRAGIEVNIWTANTPEAIKAMLKAQVDTLITDYPERAKIIQKELAKDAHARF